MHICVSVNLCVPVSMCVPVCLTVHTCVSVLCMYLHVCVFALVSVQVTPELKTPDLLPGHSGPSTLPPAPTSPVLWYSKLSLLLTQGTSHNPATHSSQESFYFLLWI